MPSKNSIKQYIENGYYHLYNRGVEKRNIFLDKQDYAVFLSYLKYYLDPGLGSDPKSLASQVEIIAYCLMPNHFHLLVRQLTKNGITKLIRALSTKYVMYFNKKYNRVGTLFQGRYKGILIVNDFYLLHLSRYIHLNPVSLGSDPKSYPYSSYRYYLGIQNITWIKSSEILGFFKLAKRIGDNDYLSYESFVVEHTDNSVNILNELILET